MLVLFADEFHNIGRWNSSPNFLLVDYYNDGSYPGSVFEVAARHNNVTYNRACCGLDTKISGSAMSSPSFVLLSATVTGVFSLLFA